MVACCTSDASLGGPFLAKSRYHIARGRRKTACSRPSGTSSYGSKNRSLTTTTRPGGRSAPSQRWGGCGRYVRIAWCCDGLTSATPSVDFSTPRSLCCSGGPGGARHPGRRRSKGGARAGQAAANTTRHAPRAARRPPCRQHAPPATRRRSLPLTLPLTVLPRPCACAARARDQPVREDPRRHRHHALGQGGVTRLVTRPVTRSVTRSRSHQQQQHTRPATAG